MDTTMQALCFGTAHEGGYSRLVVSHGVQHAVQGYGLS